MSNLQACRRFVLVVGCLSICLHAGLRAQPTTDHYGDPIASGAKLRFGTTRLRQRQGVTGVAFSPDGKQLITTGWGDSIRFWDIESGRQVRCIKCDGMSFAAVQSPDGILLASVGEGRARLWDLERDKPIFESDRVGQQTYGIAFSPDAYVFATAGKGEPVRLWDTRSGDELLQLHTGPDGGDSWPVAFSPNGNLLAGSSDEGTIHVWDLARGTPPVELKLPSKVDFVSLAFVDDKTLLSSGGLIQRGDDGEYKEFSKIQHWNVARRQLEHEFSMPGKPLLGRTPLALSRDRKTFVTTSVTMDGSTRTLFVWDVASRSVSRVIEFQQNFNYRVGTHGIAISPDKRFVAFKGNTHKVQLWDATTGNELHLHENTHHGGVLSVSPSPDGTAIATSGEDGDVHLWDTKTGKHIRRLYQNKGWSRRVVFLPSWDYMAVCGERRHGLSGFAAIIQVSNGESFRKWQLPDRAMQVAVSPDGGRLAVALGIGMAFGNEDKGPPQIQVFDILTGDKEPAEVLKPAPSNVQSLRFAEDGKTLWIVGDSGILNWKLSNDKAGSVFAHDVKRLFLTSLAHNPATHQTYVAGRVRTRDYNDSFGTVEGWDAGGQVPAWTNVYEDHHPALLAVSPDRRIMLVSNRPTAGRNARQQLVAIKPIDGTELHKWDLEDGWIRSLAFSPNGQRVFTGMDRGDILAWDVTPAYKKLKR